jgi:hypothetical protein
MALKTQTAIQNRTTLRFAATLRRRGSVVAVCVVVALLTGVAAAALLTVPDDNGEPVVVDPLHVEVLGDLHTFAQWLARNRARGYIGEVGWPDGPDADRWNELAEDWYEAADAARLWVTAWATGSWFDPAYPLAVYDASPAGLTPSAQASVVERHRSAPGVLRGVVVAGGEFGAEAPGFSNVSPGGYGTAYTFDRSATYRYLEGRGVSLVRIPFRWERVQPILGGDLDPSEISRIRQAVNEARAAGLGVVLDMHNFGEYETPDGPARLGAEIDARTFADTWRRLAIAFGNLGGVVGYGLMNEPANVQAGSSGTAARTWERLSQAAVTAIRNERDNRIVFVAGYPWSGVHDWSAHHPRAWISDPLGRIRYEAHHYWDSDHTGRYARSYAEERAAAAERARMESDAQSKRRT